MCKQSGFYFTCTREERHGCILTLRPYCICIGNKDRSARFTIESVVVSAEHYTVILRILDGYLSGDIQGIIVVYIEHNCNCSDLLLCREETRSTELSLRSERVNC